LPYLLAVLQAQAILKLLDMVGLALYDIAIRLDLKLQALMVLLSWAGSARENSAALRKEFIVTAASLTMAVHSFLGSS